MNFRYKYTKNSSSRNNDQYIKRATWRSSYWGGPLMDQLVATSKLEGYSFLLSDGATRQEKHQVVEGIVDIVSRYPSLVARGPYDGKVGKTPLEMILMAGKHARFDQVKMVTELAIKQKGGRPSRLWNAKGWKSQLPVHIACSSGSSEVIDYIASAFPTALGRANKVGMLPIDLALERRAAMKGPSLPTIKRMLKLWPESIASKKDDDNQTEVKDDGSWGVAEGPSNETGTALQRLLLRNHNELEILKTMIELFPAHRKSLRIDLQKPEDTLIIDKEHALELAKLFWKVQELRLEATLWTDGGFCHFMSHLGKGPLPFKKVSLALPAYSISKIYSEPREAMRLALERNVYLKEVSLDVCSDDSEKGFRETNKDILFLRALLAGLEARPGPLDMLELSNFELPNTIDLFRLMQSKAAPKVLILKGLQVLMPGHSITSSNSHPPKASSLERVELLRGTSTLVSYKNILSGIACHCYPWCLALEPDCSIDLTNHVVQLLKCSPLYSLDTGGSRLDHHKVINALKRNKCLRKLGIHGKREMRVTEKLVNILEHHNASIEEINPISPASDAELQSKFDYLLQLNKYGRAQVRDPDYQISTFVDLLSKLPFSSECCLRYGLLLERPELWSTTHV